MKRKQVSLLVLLICTIFMIAGCSGGNDTKPSATVEPTSIIGESESLYENTTEESTRSEIETTVAYESKDELVYAIQNVNIRKDASTDADVVFILKTGESVHRIGYNKEWSKVFVDGNEYFVSSQFLSTEQPETVPETNSVAATNPIGNGHIIAIDAGHQQSGISEKEPNGPGSSDMKAKLTSGTQGCVTGKAEYELNLEVSLLLKQELINRGYQVVMIRETNDCPLSNAERAQVANNSGAEIFVRIHANSSTNQNTNGALTMAPTKSNPYVSYLSDQSIALSQSIVNHLCTTTGAANKGVLGTDTMTGINWCTIPVSIVEMGYMSNPTEDVNMSDPTYQAKIVQGISNGIDEYFSGH